LGIFDTRERGQENASDGQMCISPVEFVGRANRSKAMRDALRIFGSVISGVSPARLTTISFGKEQPVWFETGEACRAKNRRAVSVLTNAIPPDVATR